MRDPAQHFPDSKPDSSEPNLYFTVFPFCSSSILLCLPTHGPVGWEMRTNSHVLYVLFSYHFFLCFVVFNSPQKKIKNPVDLVSSVFAHFFCALFLFT